MGAAPTAAASKLEERKKLRRENIPRNDLVGPDMVVAPWARTNRMGWYGAGQKRWASPRQFTNDDSLRQDVTQKEIIHNYAQNSFSCGTTCHLHFSRCGGPQVHCEPAVG